MNSTGKICIWVGVFLFGSNLDWSKILYHVWFSIYVEFKLLKIFYISYKILFIEKYIYLHFCIIFFYFDSIKPNLFRLKGYLFLYLLINYYWSGQFGLTLNSEGWVRIEFSDLLIFRAGFRLGQISNSASMIPKIAYAISCLKNWPGSDYWQVSSRYIILPLK